MNCLLELCTFHTYYTQHEVLTFDGVDEIVPENLFRLALSPCITALMSSPSLDRYILGFFFSLSFWLWDIESLITINTPPPMPLLLLTTAQLLYMRKFYLESARCYLVHWSQCLQYISFQSDRAIIANTSYS